MERLTFDGNFCDIVQCAALPCPYDNACSQRKVWERLKEYEDTGYTPEEITKLAKRFRNLLDDARDMAAEYKSCLFCKYDEFDEWDRGVCEECHYDNGMSWQWRGSCD